MSGMLSLSSLSQLRAEPLAVISRELLTLTDDLAEHGLVLTAEDARDLAETRERSLRDSERLEIGAGATAALLRKFSESQYLDNTTFVPAMNEIIEAFYYLKGETADKLCDALLIDTLYTAFEEICEGDVSVLIGREVDRILRAFREGRLHDRRAAYRRGESRPFRLWEKDADGSGLDEDEDENEEEE